MNNTIEKNAIVTIEPNLIVEPHRLSDAEVALMTLYIKRIKKNEQRRKLYAAKKQLIAA